MAGIEIAKKSDLAKVEDGLDSISVQVSEKADEDHNHDGTYQPIGDYAASNHTHAYSEITGTPTIPPDVSDEVNALRTELDELRGIVEGLQNPSEPTE